jgi:hypothetical protein
MYWPKLEAANFFVCIFWDPAFEANLHGAAIDLEVNPRVFDLTTPGGFVTLGAWMKPVIFHGRFGPHSLHEKSSADVWISSRWWLHFSRLTLNELLRCEPGSLVLMAPCCKSFSRMSSPQWYMKRTIFTTLGFSWGPVPRLVEISRLESKSGLDMQIKKFVEDIHVV